MYFKLIASLAVVLYCTSVAQADTCDDYNKSNRNTRLCVYVESRRAGVGHGWTCSDNSGTDTIRIDTSFGGRQYSHCRGGLRLDYPDKEVKSCPTGLCAHIETSDGQIADHCLADAAVSRIEVAVRDLNGEVKVYQCSG